MSESFSKKFLLFSGWYNIVGSLVVITFFKIFFSILYGVTYDKSLHELLLMNHIILFGFVAKVGIGLLKAAIDPVHNQAIILVSALGKLFAFATWTLSYFKSVGTVMQVFAGVSDAIFALVFLVILRNLKTK